MLQIPWPPCCPPGPSLRATLTRSTRTSDLWSLPPPWPCSKFPGRPAALLALIREALTRSTRRSCTQPSLAPVPPPPAGLHPPRGAQRVLVVAVLRGTRRSEPRRSLCLRRPKRTCDEADGPIALLRKRVSATQNTPSAWWHSRWSYNETQVTGGTGTTGPLHAQHPLLWVHTTVPVPYVEHTTGRMRRPQGE